MTRCVGGFLDNVRIKSDEKKIHVLNMDAYRAVLRQWEQHPESRDGLKSVPIKYCNYTLTGDVYLHDVDCCPLRSLDDVH
jgi:hypothetical protein